MLAARSTGSSASAELQNGGYEDISYNKQPGLTLVMRLFVFVLSSHGQRESHSFVTLVIR